MSFVQPDREDDFFYRNAQGDEVVYVSEGTGMLETPLGEIAFKGGDYLVIPRGILHRYRLSSTPSKFLVIESTGYVRTPKRYRNDHGQLTELAPYSERDIRRPAEPPHHRREGRVPAGGEEGEPAVRDDAGLSPVRSRRVGWLLLPVGAQHPRFRAARRTHPPAAARAPDLRGRRLRRLLVLPAAVRLRSGRRAGALQPLERDVR